VTLPKCRVVGNKINCPAEVAVPESGIARLELEALEATLMLPVIVPNRSQETGGCAEGYAWHIQFLRDRVRPEGINWSN
jgi:hypothetical protein